MFTLLIKAFKIPEVRKKLLFIFFVLVIFRLTAAIPVPGVNQDALERFFQQNQLFGLINIFTGSAMENLSIAMLGLGPYITAVIIMQLLTMVFPNLKKLYHEEGEEGRRKFNQYGRLLTVPLAMLQSFGFLALLRSQGIIPTMNLFDQLTAISVITAGTVFLMWLGELITEKGLGNGVSILIFAGIISSLPLQIANAVINWQPELLPTYIGFLVLSVVVVAGVVFINEGQKQIPVTYARRVRGRRLYGGVATYLPLRVNMAGVIPIIFALSIMLFPGMIASFLQNAQSPVLQTTARTLNAIFQNQLFYGTAYFSLVALFTFFYTSITFEPKTIAENLQKSGGFIPGIRPGQTTTRYISYIINRITMAGAVFLGAIAVLPLVVQGITGIAVLTIGGTAVLIVVSVVLETMKQIEAQLVMKEYEKF